MKRILLTVASLFFVSAFLYNGYSIYQNANNLMENSTTVDEINADPEKYLDENLTIYGFYSPLAGINGPTNYSLTGENSTLYVTECPDTNVMGERVFINGYLYRVEHRTIRSTADKIRQEGVYKNTTSYVVRCQKLLG